ncbi:Mitochondrial thiamine pyrophosphate carrier [Araneus ventricosus]|uniref:Mitochondrial thiamine pyrophosphate carrier n=1 Tax=Araneus ventricosus TaxID=182803 RepID=A0A4Y2L9E1_ARAVE|nr:Mitochondrial thiamine pyrophosphate carrier [Araneus ventricosus]
MVGFERPASNIKFHELDYAIAGAVSGFATRTVFQPLDVIKIRFQLQIEPISASRKSKYKGMIHAFRCIRAEEGIQALWKGIVPAQFLSTTYGALQIGYFLSLALQHLHPCAYEHDDPIEFGYGFISTIGRSVSNFGPNLSKG